jgi:uncharacterized membrane protein YkvA (DUF1232 family)
MDKNTDRESRREAARERAEAAVQERLMERRAREREEDIREGRPQRGFFTGRGRRQETDDRDDRPTDDRERGLYRSRRFRADSDRAAPRTGAKRSVMKAIRQLPSYIRLLLGLISDSRVSKVDRFFVIAAAAYIISPIDFIPDIIPFLGEVDDVFLLMFALQRLVNNAGRSVVLKHWRGDPDEIHHLNFARIISAAGFFLPSQIKRRLFRMAGFGRKRRK